MFGFGEAVMERHGGVRFGNSRRGEVRQFSFGVFRFGEACCVWFRFGKAVKVRQVWSSSGLAWSGWEWFGKAVLVWFGKAVAVRCVWAC